MKKSVKRKLSLFMIFMLCINNFAVQVSDNDGSAFITKSEFDSLKSSFQAEIDVFNKTIDTKIDSAIAAYLEGVILPQITKTTLECASTAEENWYICQNDPGTWVNKTPQANVTIVRVGGSGANGKFEGPSFGSATITGGYVNLVNPGETQNGIYATIEDETISGTTTSVAKLLGWYSWKPSAAVLALSAGGIGTNPNTMLSSLYPNIQVGADLQDGQIGFTFNLGGWTVAVSSLFVCRELETKCIKKINMYNFTSSGLSIYGQVIGDRKFSQNSVATSNWTQEEFKYGGVICTQREGNVTAWKESYSNNYKTLSMYRNSYVSEQNSYAVTGSSTLSLYDPGAGFHLLTTDRKGKVTFKFKCDTVKNTNWTMEASPTKYNYATDKTGADVMTLNNITTGTSGSSITVKNDDEILIKNVEKGSVFLRIKPVSTSERYYIFYNPENIILDFADSL